MEMENVERKHECIQNEDVEVRMMKTVTSESTRLPGSGGVCTRLTCYDDVSADRHGTKARSDGRLKIKKERERGYRLEIEPHTAEGVFTVLREE